MPNNNNNISLMGVVKTNPTYSHAAGKVDMYKLVLEVKFKDSIYNEIDIVIGKHKISDEDGQIVIHEGDNLYIKGELRSYNHFNQMGKLTYVDQFVVAKQINVIDATYYSTSYENSVYIKGEVAEEPIRQTTSKGGKMTVLTIKVSRDFRKTNRVDFDFVKVVLWNKVSENADTISQGDHVSISGYINTRTYTNTQGRTIKNTSVTGRQILLENDFN